jgi:hypothetical protein
VIELELGWAMACPALSGVCLQISDASGRGLPRWRNKGQGGRAGKTGRAAGFLHSQTDCAERCLEDTGLVRKCLNPIWTTKTETASRLRQRIETVLDWAKVHGHRTGDNPAAWRGHLQAVMPAPQKITRVEDFAARLTHRKQNYRAF